MKKSGVSCPFGPRNSDGGYRSVSPAAVGGESRRVGGGGEGCVEGGGSGAVARPRGCGFTAPRATASRGALGGGAPSPPSPPRWARFFPRRPPPEPLPPAHRSEASACPGLLRAGVRGGDGSGRGGSGWAARGCGAWGRGRTAGAGGGGGSLLAGARPGVPAAGKDEPVWASGVLYIIYLYLY